MRGGLPEARPTMGNRMGPRGRGRPSGSRATGKSPPQPEAAQGTKQRGEAPVVQSPLVFCPAPGAHSGIWEPGARERRGTAPRAQQWAQGTSDGPPDRPPHQVFRGRMPGPRRGTAPGKAWGNKKQTRASKPLQSLLPLYLYRWHPTFLSSHTPGDAALSHAGSTCLPSGRAIWQLGETRFWLSHLGERCSGQLVGGDGNPEGQGSSSRTPGAGLAP